MVFDHVESIYHILKLIWEIYLTSKYIKKIYIICHMKLEIADKG